MLGEYRKEALPNGLRVLGVENAALHSFVLSVYVRVGPRFEADDQIGLTHFLEHMLLQGSEHYPTSTAVMRGVEDVGGVVDASTHPEFANVVFGVHRKHWRRVLGIAADVIRRPLFDEAEVRQEKLIIRQELLQHRDKRGRNISASELAHCLMFKNAVDEAGTRGSSEILERLDRASLVAHHRRFFVPSNMVVCLAGGFDFDEVIDQIGEHFAGMQGDGPAPELPALPAAARRDRALYRTTEALPVAEVLLSHRAYALADDRYDACRAVAYLLGGGLSSRLFCRVREELGLVYDIQSHLQGYSDAGSLDVFVSVGADNLPAAVQAALDVLRQAAADGFAEEELERHKEGARCGLEVLCDQPMHLAEWFGKQELLLGPGRVTTPQEYVRRQEALGLSDLDGICRAVLDEHPADLVVVGPYGAEQGDALRRIFGGEEVSAGPAPGGAAADGTQTGG
jgi:predicted Zn-dependent peptidase